MQAAIFEIFIILALLVLNGIFAMSEIAIVSARKARLQQMAGAGSSGARKALELSEEPNRFFSTIQVGITLVGILAGAFGGATIGQRLSEQLATISWIAPYSGAVGFGAVVVAITYLSLVVGELAPKQVALRNPERIASAVGIPLWMLSNLAYPVVRLLSLSIDALLWLLRIPPSEESPVTEEEVKILIREGARAGIFEEMEQDIVQRVFLMGDRRASTLMTPRGEIVWLDIDDPYEENRRKIIESGHSRFPVAQGSLDNVLGIVHVKGLLARITSGQEVDFEASVQPPLFVPERLPAFRLLEVLKQSGVTMALVTDEYGGVEGLITLTDILEALVGDLPSRGEPVGPRATSWGEGSWLVDGLLPVDEFKALFDIRSLPGERDGNYDTLAGFIMMQMGRIPQESDRLEWDGMTFEIVDMDGNRIDKVMVASIPTSEEGKGPNLE
jgi:putative hemolysin